VVLGALLVNCTESVLDTLTKRKEIVGGLILTEPDEAASRFDSKGRSLFQLMRGTNVTVTRALHLSTGYEIKTSP
jgi:hypothetical protein